MDPAGRRLPDPQDWCNPPGRGLGIRPTTDTGDPLADAFLWVKVPGESDGQCSRGLTDNGGVDPEWGIVDPPAGAWFPSRPSSWRAWPSPRSEAPAPSRAWARAPLAAVEESAA